eukprot:TRINITY_DN19584_c0_g1_i1.p1 TRINITY_DN19584_c0_g1~~TRINITY_DN19584_c0_g1_i1.p1  ORF type:complete len:364 (-),score=59.73 TRINITY_DN19584_c0_g1_i1:169-1260(-)
MLTENGPYALNSTGSTARLQKRDVSWNQEFNLLYIDQPAGTGFSFTGTEDSYVRTEGEVASQFYAGLLAFFGKHPELRANPLFLTGESYAGKYIPHIAHLLWKRSKEPQTAWTPRLQGIAIGNGLINPGLQIATVPDYALAGGFISPSQHSEALSMVDACSALIEKQDWCAATKACLNTTDEIWKRMAGGIFRYDTRQLDGSAFDRLTSDLAAYLNRSDVRQALHVGDHYWMQSDGSTTPNKVSDSLACDFMLPDPATLLGEMLDDSDPTTSIRALVYEGVYDGSCCNVFGMTLALEAMSWSGQSTFKAAENQAWQVSGKVAGHMRRAGVLSFVNVYGAGHLVPSDQPVHALQMITDFVRERL